MRRSIVVASFLVLTVASHAPEAVAAPVVVASEGDASIVHDQGGGFWTLSSGGTTLKLALDVTRDFAITSLVTGSGSVWTTNIR
jgi:hypothetical protein